MKNQKVGDKILKGEKIMYNKKTTASILCIAMVIQIIIAMFANVFYNEAASERMREASGTKKSGGILESLFDDSKKSGIELFLSKIEEAGISSEDCGIDGRYSVWTPLKAAKATKKFVNYFFKKYDATGEIAEKAIKETNKLFIGGLLLSLFGFTILLISLAVLLKVLLARIHNKSVNIPEAWQFSAINGVIAIVVSLVINIIYVSAVKGSQSAPGVGFIVGRILITTLIVGAITGGEYFVEKVFKNRGVGGRRAEFDAIIASGTILIEFLVIALFIFNSVSKNSVKMLVDSNEEIQEVLSFYLGNSQYTTLSGMGICIVIVSGICIIVSYCLKFSNTKFNNDTGFVICPNCQQHVSIDKRYCSKCGTELPHTNSAAENVCSKCGKHLQINEKYCPNCGNKVEPRKPKKFCPYCGVATEDDVCQKCGRQIRTRVNSYVQQSSSVCPRCGAECTPGKKFCTKCGMNLTNDSGINC